MGGVATTWLKQAVDRCGLGGGRALSLGREAAIEHAKSVPTTMAIDTRIAATQVTAGTASAETTRRQAASNLVRAMSERAKANGAAAPGQRAWAEASLGELQRLLATDDSYQGAVASRLAGGTLSAIATLPETEAARRLQVATLGVGYALRGGSRAATAVLRDYAASAVTFLDGSAASPALKRAWLDAYLSEMQGVVALGAPDVQPALRELVGRVSTAAEADPVREFQRRAAGTVAIQAMAAAPADRAEAAALDALAARATSVYDQSALAIGPAAQWTEAYKQVMTDLITFRTPIAPASTAGATVKKATAARRMSAAADLLASCGARPLEVTPAAAAALDHNQDSRISAKELLGGLVRERVTIDPALGRVTTVERAIKPDSAIMPADVSQTFKDDKGRASVEQCMEFVLRYFKERRAKEGAVGPSLLEEFRCQQDLSGAVRNMAAGKVTRPGYQAFLNGGTRPPVPGSILSAKGPGGFHVALVTAVERKGDGYEATLYQANVPLYNNSHLLEDHLQQIPLTNHDGRWFLPPLPTSAQAYHGDMAVVGWIEPAPERGLPEAAEPVAVAMPPETVAEAIEVVRKTLRVVGAA